MSILLVGLNHQTAPLDLRERLALPSSRLGDALHQLKQLTQTVSPLATSGAETTPNECVIVSTCNRLELYVTAGDAADGWAAVEQFIAEYHNLPLAEVKPQLYYRSDRGAVEHAMRLAAGLDSMVLGEPQILSQVALAYGAAHDAATSGPLLSQLFTRATHTGKRARTETAISRHSTSVGHVAALLLKSKLGNLAQARVLVLGAGTMAEVAARAFQLQGAQSFTCINRTYARAETLAAQLGGDAIEWTQLTAALTWADIVVAATSAPHPVIDAAELLAVQPLRQGRPLFFVDLAVPRNIDKAVDELPQVLRYDVDDLQSVLDANIAQRQAAVPQVERIVEQEVERFMAWLHSRQVVPVIADLRSKALDLANHEVQQTLRQLKELDQRGCELVVSLAHRIINKLLHEPTVRLKVHAGNGSGDSHVLMLRDLFALDAVTLTRGQLAAEALALEVGRARIEHLGGSDDA